MSIKRYPPGMAYLALKPGESMEMDTAEIRRVMLESPGRYGWSDEHGVTRLHRLEDLDETRAEVGRITKALKSLGVATEAVIVNRLKIAPSRRPDWRRDVLEHAVALGEIVVRRKGEKFFYSLPERR